MTHSQILNFFKKCYLIIGNVPLVEYKYDGYPELYKELKAINLSYNELDESYGFLFKNSIGYETVATPNEFFIEYFMNLPENKCFDLYDIYSIYTSKKLAKDLDLKYNTNLEEQFDFILKEIHNDTPKKWRKEN